jgi:penicillin amidase
VREEIERGAITKADVDAAIANAAADFGEGVEWGAMHRLRLRHPAGNVPVLGRPYQFGDYPINGSTGTIHKSAHGVTNELHGTTFGANSRHVSDLSDPDANDFVLIGGQDGYLGSENYLDQWAMFQRGEFVRVPLREETARASFTRVTRLRASE